MQASAEILGFRIKRRKTSPQNRSDQPRSTPLVSEQNHDNSSSHVFAVPHISHKIVSKKSLN
jgi:hypothetical protein